MMKLLRKYMRPLLVFFGVALMIVFIGGTALEYLITPEFNPVLGKTKYEDVFGNKLVVAHKDLMIAEQTTTLLGRLGYYWQFPAGPAGAPLQPLDWVLLNREVDALGMRQPIESGKTGMLTRFGADQVDQLSRRWRIRRNPRHP